MSIPNLSARSFSLLLIVVFFISCSRSKHLTVSTYAGNGKLALADGKAGEASFSNLMGVATDTSGNVYVADSRNNCIRKISSDGIVTTIAGSGKQGSADGKGRSASFFFPAALTAGADGSVYVADTQNNLIRKIKPDGTVTVIAGQLTSSIKEHPDSLQRLDNPYGIAAGKDGTIYFTDWARDVIRKIGPDGRMSIVAGNLEPGARDGKSVEASFYLPQGIAVDGKGNLFVADTYNNMIRMIDPNGVVRTLAGKAGKKNKGSKDGKGSEARFSHPCGVAVDAYDNVYVADVGNNKIRKVTLDGTVTTFAGTGKRGADNGDADKATFYRPCGVAVDRAGNVYVADYQNNVVRKISR